MIPIITASTAAAGGAQPTRGALIGVGVFVTMCLLLAVLISWGCATVQVTAEREGRCRIRPDAPFEVRCWSDGKEVLIWAGPMALTIEEKRP